MLTEVIINSKLLGSSEMFSKKFSQFKILLPSNSNFKIITKNNCLTDVAVINLIFNLFYMYLFLANNYWVNVMCCYMNEERKYMYILMYLMFYT